MIIIIRPIGCYLLIPYIHHQTLQQHQPLCEYYVLIYRCIFIIIGGQSTSRNFCPQMMRSSLNRATETTETTGYLRTLRVSLIGPLYSALKQLPADRSTGTAGSLLRDTLVFEQPVDVA